MCLIKVKEDEQDYSVPSRVVRRERRRSPPRTTRVSRTYVEERRPENVSVERTYIIPAPPPAPATIYSEPSHHSHRSERAHSQSPPPPPPPASVGPPASMSRTHFVEVEAASISSSSSSSSDDARSRTTHKTAKTSKTAKSSKSKSSAPGSEYHLREKEYRRERDYGAPPREEYETYRYVEPPEPHRHDRGGYGRDRGASHGSRNSFADDPRASRSSYRRERMIVENSDGRRTREYRQ